MGKINQLNIWTNIISMHQIPWMHVLIKKGWVINYIISEPITKDRTEMGWEIPDINGISVVIKPNYQIIERLLNQNADSTVNLFGAIYSYPWALYALFKAIKLKRNIALISEACDPDGWKAIFRFVKYRLINLLIKKQTQFILAMGQLGVDWFIKLGYSKEIVFPFGYFVKDLPEILSDEPIIAEQENKFAILFVGSLIERKRVDEIIRSVSLLTQYPIKIIIVGDGPEKGHLHLLSKKLHCSQIIHWAGFLPWRITRKLMNTSDLLILPSRFDGWGAVVNEAIMAGTPVICSDHCGAKDLLKNKHRGAIFSRCVSGDLTSELRTRIEKGKITQTQRDLIKRWSTNISGESAAEYLISIISYIYCNDNIKPTPPWYKD